MKRKMFLSMLVLVAMLFTACAPKATPTPVPATPKPAAPTATPKPVEKPPTPGGCPLAVEDGATIVFSGWGDETEQNIYRDSIARFSKVCPDVTVDFQPIPADFQTTIKARMAGGTAPDVFYVDDQLMAAFGPTGQLLPLEDFMAEAGVKRSDFIEALLTIFTYEGKTYGLPKDWGTLGLVYLPKVFEAAGIDEPTADWTWNDLKAAAEAIAANTDYAGFCQNADWARFAPFAFGAGGSYTNDAFTKGAMNSPEVVSAAEFVVGMYEDGSLVTSADVGAGWCGEAIGKELVGMTYEGGWMVNYMRQDYPDVNWKAIPLPKSPAGKAADVIFTNAIGINAATKYPKAAAAFLIYVTGRENQAEIVKTGFAYSTHPDQVDLVVDPNDAAIAQGGLVGRVAYWGPCTGQINDTIGQALNRAFLGEQNVKEALEQAKQEADEILATCGAPPKPEVKCPLAVEDGATIVFSGWGDETEQNIYRDSIARFSKVCPDVTVDFQPIPADFQTTIKARMAGGTAPDVFYVDDQLMAAFGPTGQLLPLEDFMAEAGVKRSDFIEALLTIFTYEGKTYGLPKDWGTLGLVYLPKVFEAAGIDEPTADWTWNDLKAAAEAIAANTDYAGFCQNADWARFAPFAFGAGGSYTNDAFTKGAMNSPEVVSAAEFVVGMYEDGSLVTSADVGAGWCGEAIGKELVGMTYEGGWMVNYMRQDYPDVNWKAIPLPKSPAGKAADVIFTNAIGINAATKYPKAAAAFLIYVTGRENQAEIVKTGFAYSTHPDQVDLVVDPNDAAIAQGGLVGRVAYWGPCTGQVNDTIGQALNRAYLGEQTVQEALEQAKQEADEILATCGQ